MSEKTILYIEDNEYNRKIVRQLLIRTSYRLIESVDGDARARSQLRQPSLQFQHRHHVRQLGRRE